MYQKVNQDSFAIKKSLSGVEDVWLIAVADGHGLNGHIVAKFVKRCLAEKFELEDKRIMKQQLTNISTFSSVF